jgi:hypothetical protein
MDSSPLEGKLRIIGEYLRAGNIPEERVATNIENLRRLTARVSSIVQPDEQETDRQLLARVEMVKRCAFEGLESPWTSRDWEVLDVLRGTKNAVWALFGVLGADINLESSDAFAKAIGLNADRDDAE